MVQRLLRPFLLFPQVAQQVVDLRFAGRFLGELSEYALGNPLRALTLERSLAAETMAFDAAKTFRHQLVRSSIMLLGRFVLAQIGKLDGQPRLDAISVCEMRQRVLVHLYRALEQASLVEPVR